MGVSEKNDQVIPEAQNQQSQGPLRVLIAEDNEINQELLVRILRKGQHHVAVANDGHEVLQTLDSDQFDIIIMDVQMPGMSGLEATKAIRQSEAGTDRHIVIIGFSASCGKWGMKLCLEAGMDDFVTKPIKQDELFAVIEKTLARRKAASV